MGKTFDILVIDDEQVITDAVSRIATAHRYRVDSAADGARALQRIERDTFRLILCDIMMPGLDGFQVLDKVRSQFPETAVVMTTGYATVDHAVRSLRSGAAGYLAKPFTEEELVSTIQRGLRYRSAETETPPSAVATDPARGPDGAGKKAVWHRLGWISWVRLDEPGSAFVGVTRSFLDTVGPIDRVELLEENDDLVQGTPCAHLVATDGLSHDLLSPISGTIVEAHKRLRKEVSLLERDPSGEGWLYRVIPADVTYEVQQLTMWTVGAAMSPQQAAPVSRKRQ